MYLSPPESPDAARRYREGRRVTLAGALLSLVLSAVKMAAGILGRSQAMVADSVHSLSDLFTDIAVWVGLRFSAVPPDANHPWGHGKIETVVSALVGATLAVVGFGIGAEALVRLRAGVDTRPTALALGAAALAIVLKELAYRWTVRVGRRIRSQALLANAWHHRSDALSSVAALAGIGGAMLGLEWMDPLAAAAVSLFIVAAGSQILWRGLVDLTERQVDAGIVRQVQRLLEEDPDVIDAHRLRLRNVGGIVVGDVHVRVDGAIRVREGHAISKRLELRALSEVAALEDLVIHIDPNRPPGA
ncbi:MAG: cation transporter [Planctomycetes bacterium]|nr:cation transporter [Planctomycetota bacterium]